MFETFFSKMKFIVGVTLSTHFTLKYNAVFKYRFLFGELKGQYPILGINETSPTSTNKRMKKKMGEKRRTIAHPPQRHCWEQIWISASKMDLNDLTGKQKPFI